MAGLLLALAGLLLVPVTAPAAEADGDQNVHPGEITTATAGFAPQQGSPRRVRTAALSSATAAATPPFTECPPVGADTSCGLLVEVSDSGVSILQDPTQGPYDGVEDTLIGVLNRSSKNLGHLSLGSNTDMFGFDGDGICGYGIDPGCPFGDTGYEGPGTSFTEISGNLSSGVVYFNPTIPPGGTSYFSLEEPLSSTTVVSGGPSTREQGGAPNGSERRTTCSKGHPVNCATGVFWHEFVDAEVPGRGVPLTFTRTYSSMNAAEDGPLGFGWSDSYGMSLSIDSETGAATVHEESGSAVTFPSNGEGGFVTPPRVLATLEANEDGTYSFSRYSDHIDYVFSAGGELLKEIDRNGNVTALSYSGGLVEKVTDPSGRSLAFAYAGGRIHTITDPMGRTTTFSYDGEGNLKEATDPAGRTWSFSYDGSHRLLTMTDPRGGVISNAYDSSGRVVSQTDPMGRESTWQYEGEPATSEGGATTFTDGRGDVTRYSYRDLEMRSVTRGVGTASEATTSYEYDPITLGVTSVTDPNGGVTHNRYDSRGNLLETVDPLYRTTYYSYGPSDEVETITDPRGTTTEYRYDGSGNLLEEETYDYEAGEAVITTYGYEAEPGELTRITNPDGHTTTFGYDNAGDRTSFTDADGNKTTYAYDLDSELTSKVFPAGNAPGGNPAAHSAHYAYDADGELTTETDQLGHATSYGYDQDGNRITTTDANGHVTHHVYDADGELIEVVRPDGTALKTVWDAAGNMTEQVDGAGHATTYEYDAQGRVESVTDPDGRETSYGYDPAGNRTSLVDPEGEVTSYEYDADNELVAIYYSDAGMEPVFEEYDEDGNRIGLVDGSGTSTFTYDPLDRMTSATDGAGATVGYEYDLAGNLVKLTYPGGQAVTRTFDAAGNLVSLTDWLGHTSNFKYDTESNLAKEEYGNGVTADLAYDSANRLTSINDTHGPTALASFSYTRDPLGQVTDEVSENGGAGTVGYSRNALDQLTAANSASYGYDAADNPTTFGATTQHFDPANELTTITSSGEGGEESEGGAEGGGPSEGTGPPASGNPPAVGDGSPSGPSAAPSQASLPSPAPGKRLRCRKGFKTRKVHGKKKCVKPRKKRHRHSARQRPFEFAGRPGVLAAAGPSSSATGTGGGDLGGQPPRSASTELVRHLTYNARGDRVTEELAGGGVRSLTYDQADRLIAVGNTVEYTYDGDGLRISKTVDGATTAEVWNQAEAMPQLLESGSTSYVYGPGGQPVEQIAGGTATYMQEDQQGSVRLLTDTAGAAVGRYDYDPWGNVTAHTGSATTELQFDGQLTDSETGYQYLRARFYDPGTGQFLTQDPLFSVTRARYSFTANKPTDYFDPSGLGSCLLWHNSNGSCWGGSKAITVTKAVHVATGAIATGAAVCTAVAGASVIGDFGVSEACGVGTLAAGGLTLASGEVLYATNHQSTGGLFVDIGGVVPVGKLFGRLEKAVNTGIGLYGTISSIRDWNYGSGPRC